MSALLDQPPVRGDSGTPLWVAVRDRVRHAIDAGLVTPGERLPSTKALSESMEVSLVTMHRALQDLVAAGVVRRGQGRGTYVHESYGSDDRKVAELRLGLVVQPQSTLADPYHSQVFDGVKRATDAAGIDLVLLRYGEDLRNECHGFLYLNPLADQLDAHPQQAGGGPRNGSRGGASRTPVIVVGATYEIDGVECVDTENVSIGRGAVEELHRLGHERIGFVGERSAVRNAVDRRHGFRVACLDLRIEPQPSHIIGSADWRLADDERALLTEILTKPDRPTAIFASGYYFALDVYTAAKQAGLRIPEDLSVIGVDDPPSAEHLSPALTTFRQPLAELGRRAVELVVARSRGETPPRHTEPLRARLIRRASAAQRNGEQP